MFVRIRRTFCDEREVRFEILRHKSIRVSRMILFGIIDEQKLAEGKFLLT